MRKLRENLKIEMEKKGWNAYDLQRECGVTQPTINRFITGKHQELKDLNVKKIAKAIGIDESQLRGLESTAEKHMAVDQETGNGVVNEQTASYKNTTYFDITQVALNTHDINLFLNNNKEIGKIVTLKRKFGCKAFTVVVPENRKTSYASPGDNLVIDPEIPVLVGRYALVQFENTVEVMFYDKLGTEYYLDPKMKGIEATKITDDLVYKFLGTVIYWSREEGHEM